MATPAGRPTYAGWLDKIAQEGRTDAYGLVAAAWWNARDHGRPRLSAVRSVNQWLAEHPPPGVANLQATLHQLEQAYHDAGGLPEQTAPAGHQQADQAADQQQDWFASPEGQAWLASPDGQQWLAAQHPEQTLANVMAGQEPAQQEFAYQEPDQPADQDQYGPVDVPEHPYQVIMLAIARLENQIGAFWQAMAPLVQLAAETMQVNAAIDASQLAQPSPAQQRARQIAAEHGWTPGPAIPQPEPGQPVAGQDFYRGAVPPPDYAQMAADAEAAE